ncbi:response regulator [Salinicoccus halodurans]|uniref:LuxR family transcriptional regulator n=1 Tax=Salinicoccus halodurans TaxID=407035 RepID=A0A0F7D4L4_9STAP|nr:response regulator transcription factor [Salinicoccus halodurans]AKG74440.1 LuxR family transcriptional regulator [Salinicoccus halodurans]SFK96034.1 two component transcriptional regulator, LuxR family [Salinicoccus halodurans]
MYKIIMTDDHHIVREGMKFLLSTTEDIRVIEDFGTGAETLEFLSENHRDTDLVLLDLVMPEMDGIEVTRRIKAEYPGIKVLVLSSYTSEEYIRPVFAAQADGYIIKEMAAEELIESIKNVIEGEKVIHPDILEVIDREGDMPHEKNILSAREIEVLKEIVKGKSNKEIGKALFVSEKTVKTHVSHILNKLEVSDRTQAVIYAIKYNIVEF